MQLSLSHYPASCSARLMIIIPDRPPHNTFMLVEKSLVFLSISVTKSYSTFCITTSTVKQIGFVLLFRIVLRSCRSFFSSPTLNEKVIILPCSSCVFKIFSSTTSI